MDSRSWPWPPPSRPCWPAAAGPNAGRPARVAAQPAALPAALPVGSPPRVAYGFAEHPTFQGGDWQLVRPDGSRQPLPSVPGEVVAYDDRVVNGYGTEGGFVVEVVDRRGRVVGGAEGLCAFGLVTTADHTQVGWLDGRSLVTLDREGTLERRRRVALPPVECGRLVPVALDRSRVYVAGSRRSDPYVLRPGRHPYSLEALHTITDVTRSKAVGLRADPSHCSAMVNLLGVRQWQTCDHRLLDAAPDGRHLLGVVGGSRFGRIRAVSVFTRAGDQVAEWRRPAGATLEDVRWEDSGHLLVVVHDANGWSLVRLGVDGSVEYAVTPVAVPPDYSPFRLPLS